MSLNFLKKSISSRIERAGRLLPLPFAEPSLELVVERSPIVQAGERIGPRFGFVRLDLGGLRGELLLGLLELLLQLGVGGQDSV